MTCTVRKNSNLKDAIFRVSSIILSSLPYNRNIKTSYTLCHLMPSVLFFFIASILLLGDIHARLRAEHSDVHTDSVAYDLHVSHGVHMPRIGLGTAAMSGKTVEVVKYAISVGVRLIDTAQAKEWYSEEDVGEGIVQYCQELGEEKCDAIADELTIVTKIHPRSFREDKMRRMLEQSKHLLYSSWNPDKDSLDIVLLHSPYCWTGHCSREEESHSWQNAWRTLEALKEEGMAKAIGVSNFDIKQLEELDSLANAKIAVVQNWMDPFNQDRLVRAFCSKRGIAYMAYSSLGTQWEGKFQGNNPVLSDPTLLGIAKMHKTSVAAVVNSWLLQEGVVAIPRTTTFDHIRQNAFTDRILDNGHIPVFLSDADIEIIRGLDGTKGTLWE